MKRILQAPIAHGALALGLALAVMTATVGCSDPAPAVDAGPLIDAPPEIGTLSLSWTIEDDNGNPLDCAQVGAQNVRVTATPAEGGFATPEAFGCNGLTGTSMPVDSGTYNVEIDVTASVNQMLQPLIPEPVLINGVEVVTGQDTDLGTFAFAVIPRGGVEFILDAQQAGGNCETQANGGAELSEFLIEVFDADGTCVPSTLTLTDSDGVVVDTYDSDCAGARYGCIESDITVSMADVQSGTTSLNIIAYRGPDPCYSRNPQFSVPGGDLVTELIPQMLNAIGVCMMP